MNSNKCEKGHERNRTTQHGSLRIAKKMEVKTKPIEALNQQTYEGQKSNAILMHHKKKEEKGAGKL